ncbi:hypothetical protein [Schlesneria sp. T3-172]|uniref:hypothetical protein n=1 Tax=Schlesneria sphaerica TaxID=3373610 RepID=UPI0037CA462D
MARSLMALVPERVPATVALNPDSNTVTLIPVHGAWLKPVNVALTTYGGVNLQGNETLLMVPDHELNSQGEGREIRPRDKITCAGATYRVHAARLKTVRTVWECVVRKEIG